MNCLFYASVFPIGIVITVVGLIFSYWIDKWWLVRYCCIPKYSFRLGKMIVNICIVRIVSPSSFHVYIYLAMLQIYIWLIIIVSKEILSLLSMSE
jgi:hypothetical protein